MPPAKRAKVEAVYAAVRYPDEVVDSFPLTQMQRAKLLDDWSEHYDAALRCRSLRQSLENGAPVFCRRLCRSRARMRQFRRNITAPFWTPCDWTFGRVVSRLWTI